MDASQLSGASLAYAGDAVYETFVRERLLNGGMSRPKELNRAALSFVTAAAQSEAVKRLLPLLDEEENEIYKRGRNAHGISAPKNADTADYRRATGLEALFGWLYLTGKEARARELFEGIFPKNDG